MNETVNTSNENGSHSGKESNEMPLSVRFAQMVAEISPKKLLHHENFIKALPFIFFLFGLAMIYISNSYYAERSIREIYRVGLEIKEMRSEYISTKSDLMLMSKQSQVARTVSKMGLKESVVPPRKIVVRKQVND